MPNDVNINGAEREVASRQQSGANVGTNGIYTGNTSQPVTIQPNGQSSGQFTYGATADFVPSVNANDVHTSNVYLGAPYAYHPGGVDYAQQQQQEASRQAALAAERERARNEQLRRDRDAKISRDAQEAQRKRRDERQGLTKAAGQNVDTRRDEQREQKKQEPRSPFEIKEIIGTIDTMDDLDSQPSTRMESTGYVDIDTGELVDTASPASRVDRIAAEEVKTDTKRRSKGRMAKSRMAAAMKSNNESLANPGDRQYRRERLKDMNALDAMQTYAREQEYEQEANDNLDAMDVYDRERSYDQPIEDMLDSVDAMQAYSREVQAEAEGAGNIAAVPDISQQDTPWEIGSDVTNIRDASDEKKINRILRDEDKRQSLAYEDIRESDGDPTGNFADQRRGIFPSIDEMTGAENETTIRGVLMKARNAIYRRWLNPASLRIESEHVVERTERINGKERVYATIGYSNRVEKAIGVIRGLYNCSTYDVMQLVQLRAGIGVDSKGKIAKVDPNKFKLTDDQFCEIIRDIYTSQEKNGHPLGSVDGRPGGSGVRDDTGRYVVVAKTRCFPLGYMPEQLLNDLKRNWNSPLHGQSNEQIQKMIADEWINKTYPTLSANTGGNLMWQARAIENMMRALMMMDGVNPSERNIPDVVERQTLMMHRNEVISMGDPQISMAIEERQKRDEQALSRFKHRAKKRNGTRDSNGNIQTGSMRSRLRKLDRAFTTLSSLESAGRAARVMIMVSGALEGAIAEGQMSVSNYLADAAFKSRNDISSEYEMTEKLNSMSESAEAVEARSIAESLYRMDGLDMLRGFLSDKGDDGRAKYKLNQQSFRQFLYDYGFSDKNPVISEETQKKFGIKPENLANVIYNVQHIMDSLDNYLLGSSNMFKTRTSKQFVKMSMSEMMRSSVAGRESYTSSQVEEWGASDGENLVRSLLQTDAGLEAFMTQGVTSLSRKSPLQNRMRAILGASGMTSYAVRKMFGQFIEYGVSKVTHFPGSNTLSYLSSAGIKSIGDLMSAASDNMPLGGVPNMADAMQRNFDYQIGASYNQGTIDMGSAEGRVRFKEGLVKNLRYDMVMAGTEVGKALLVNAILQTFGGLFPPDDEDERYTFSEWKLGGENGLPIKFAWWMDDLAGLGLPLGISLTLLHQYGWDSKDAKDVASNGFINMIANFNDGTAIFNAIDFVNDPASYIEDFLGTNVQGYNPSFAEMSQAWLSQRFWDLLGNMTPAFAGELIPWSRDFLFKGDADEHTPYKYFDSEGKEQDVGDYSELMKRLGARNNWLQAMFYDFTKSSDVSSYKYAEMPLATRVDPLAMKLYSEFYLDTNNLPLDQDERMDFLNGSAVAVISYIEQNYKNADQAVSQGFALNYEQLRNCRRYCFDMIDQIEADFQAELDQGYMSSDQFYARKDEVKEQKQHYYDLVDEYFKDGTKIPTTVPHYVKQETDLETKYVDDSGKAKNFIDALLGNAHAEQYRYGNIPSILPVSSPRRNETTGYNFERIPYWVRLDDDGNPISDVGSMYDLAGTLGPLVNMGKFSGKDVQELMWGGQGNNMYDGVSERLNIPREGVPTVGERALRISDEDIPESLRNMSDADMFGIPEKKGTDSTADDGSNASGSKGKYYPGYSYSKSYGGGRSYSRGGSYYRSGGGGGYSSPYNPKIYSTPRQVNGDRASGLSTKTPYKATTTYLRPGFYTKGSREAYRRQDI